VTAAAQWFVSQEAHELTHLTSTLTIYLQRNLLIAASAKTLFYLLQHDAPNQLWRIYWRVPETKRSVTVLSNKACQGSRNTLDIYLKSQYGSEKPHSTLVSLFGCEVGNEVSATSTFTGSGVLTGISAEVLRMQKQMQFNNA